MGKEWLLISHSEHVTITSSIMLSWKSIFFICCFLQRFNAAGHREKRWLAYGYPLSRMQFLAGVGIPVDLDLETVIIGSVIKTNYILPPNASVYLEGFPTIEKRRKRRSFSRWQIYDLFAAMTSMRGLDGKSCILRTICEMAHRPVDRNNGFLDEIVHVMFNPKTTTEDLNHHSDNEYFAAHQFGKESGEFCHRKFSECPISITDLFTM